MRFNANHCLRILTCSVQLFYIDSTWNLIQRKYLGLLVCDSFNKEHF